MYCGARPIFLDVSRETLGLSPSSLSEFLDTNTEQKSGNCFNKITKLRIAACVPMHTFGHPCEIDKIVDICGKHHIKGVEDAAEIIGSFYKGRHTGTFGDIGVLSFNGNKIITTGGGGMLLFNDIGMAKHAKNLTNQAKVPHPWEFIHDQVGYNYRMPNINAALGVAQMEHLKDYVRKKRHIAQSYSDFFKTRAIEFFTEPDNSRSNYWLNIILLEDREERDRFLKYSNENGITTRPAWTLLNKLNMFKDCQMMDLTTAHWLENRMVNLPSSVIENIVIL